MTTYKYKELTIPWTCTTGPGIRILQDSTDDIMNLEALRILNLTGYRMSPEMAKEAFWQEERSAILQELSYWFDKGWEPVIELGSTGVELQIGKANIPNSSDKFHYSFLGIKEGNIVAIPKAYHVVLRHTKSERPWWKFWE